MQRSAGEPHFSHGRDSDFRCAQKSLAVQGTVSKNLCCSFKIIFPHQSYIPHRSETGCRPWLPNKRSSPKDQSGAFGGLAQVSRMNNPWTGCPALRGVRSMGTTAGRSGDFPHPHLRSPGFVHQNWSGLAVRGLAQFPAWTVTRSVAPRFVGFEAWAPLLLRSGDFSHLHLRSPRFVHHNWSRFTVSILTIAAPWPLVRFKHQASLNRLR